jgi:hypothetical protein
MWTRALSAFQQTVEKDTKGGQHAKPRRSTRSKSA